MREDSAEMQTSHMDKEVLRMTRSDVHGGEERFCDRWYRLGSVFGWRRSIWYSLDDLTRQCQAQSEV